MLTIIENRTESVLRQRRCLFLIIFVSVFFFFVVYYLNLLSILITNRRFYSADDLWAKRYIVFHLKIYYTTENLHFSWSIFMRAIRHQCLKI